MDFSQAGARRVSRAIEMETCMMRTQTGRQLWMLYAAELMWTLIGCNRPPTPPPPPPPAVTVTRPLEREVIEWDEYTGRLDPVESVEVRARVSGLLESVPFKEGSNVKKGDVLFTIDVRPFQAELDKALAQ